MDHLVLSICQMSLVSMLNSNFLKSIRISIPSWWQVTNHIAIAICYLFIGSLIPELQSHATNSATISAGISSEFPVRPNQWCLQEVVAKNFDEESQRIACVCHEQKNPLLQFGRTFVVPPNSQRRLIFPVLTPDIEDMQDNQLVYRTLYFDASDADQWHPWKHSNAAAQERQAIIDNDEQVTGILVDSDPLDRTQRLVRIARVMAGQTPRIYILNDSRPLPGFKGCFESFDQVVLASERLIDDPEGIIALRHWVLRGGKLWIILNKVPPQTLNNLLGDAWKGAILDQASLIRYQLLDARGTSSLRDGKDQTLQEPVEMLQTYVDQGTIHYRVNGWPAAFRIQLGQGSVLVTTIEARAWYEGLPGEALADPSDRRFTQELRTLSAKFPLGILARSFFHEMQYESPEQTIQEAANQLIGYRIPGRWFISIWLGGLSVVLCFAGLLLHQRGRATWGLIFAPLAAFIVAALLIVSGQTIRAQIPSMFASTEVVTIESTTDDSVTQGAVALYRQKSTEELSEGQGGVCLLRPAGGESGMRRFIWTGLDRWEERWQLPNGITEGQFAEADSLNGSFSCEAYLSNEGLRGQLRLPTNTISDRAVFSTGWGPALSVRLEDDGSFFADSSAELEPGRFIDNALVDDVIRRREAFMRKVLVPGNNILPTESLTLLCWTEAWGPNLSLTQEEVRRGEALVSAPVRLNRPATGTTIHIPASLIPFETVEGPDGTALTAAYSTSDRMWVKDLSRQSKISLRFQLPVAMLPLEVKSVRLTVDIHAPGRNVSFFAWRETERLPVQQVDSPIRSQMSIPFEVVDTLQLDAEGGLTVSIVVGPHLQENEGGLATTGWRIDHVFLSAMAVVKERK